MCDIAFYTIEIDRTRQSSGKIVLSLCFYQGNNQTVILCKKTAGILSSSRKDGERGYGQSTASVA